jgi:hypothetical protein
MSRNVCISAVDGQTGFLIAELLLTDQKFSSKVDSVCGLQHPQEPVDFFTVYASEFKPEHASRRGRLMENRRIKEYTVCETNFFCLIFSFGNKSAPISLLWSIEEAFTCANYPAW